MKWTQEMNAECDRREKIIVEHYGKAYNVPHAVMMELVEKANLGMLSEREAPETVDGMVNLFESHLEAQIQDWR